jgi:phosphoglycerate dehydrogenase-like enzyme
MMDAFVISRLTFLVAVGLASFAGAAIDVFDQEPLPLDHPFLGA